MPAMPLIPPFRHAAKPALAVPSGGGASQLEPPLQPEALVLLDVGGMKCGGCSAAVKRMLAARPDVESAAVNLVTETAAVRFRWGGLASDGVRGMQWQVNCLRHS